MEKKKDNQQISNAQLWELCCKAEKSKTKSRDKGVDWAKERQVWNDFLMYRR